MWLVKMLPRPVKNLLLLFLSICLVLLLLELAVRLFVPDPAKLLAPHRDIPPPPLSFQPDKNGAEPKTQYDAYLGWKNRPGASGIAYGPDGLVSRISINSLGLRDREADYSKPPGLKRILVLGDSFAWGYGLKAEERFSDLLHDAFPETQVLNLGVVGYSTDQESVLLEREGLKYDPDMVILLVHDTDIFHNGLRANYGKPKPYYTLKNGRLKRHGIPVPRRGEGELGTKTLGRPEGEPAGSENNFHFLKRQILSRLRLYQFISGRLKMIGPLRSLLIDLKLVEPDRPVIEDVRLTAAIIEQMKNRARKGGVDDYLVLLVPSKEVINYHLPAAAGKKLFLKLKNTEILKREEAVKRLIEYLKVFSIPAIDLTPEFIERAGEGEDLYFINDNHWNARANKIAAEKITPFLQKKSYK